MYNTYTIRLGWLFFSSSVSSYRARLTSPFLLPSLHVVVVLRSPCRICLRLQSISLPFAYLQNYALPQWYISPPLRCLVYLLLVTPSQFHLFNFICRVLLCFHTLFVDFRWSSSCLHTYCFYILLLICATINFPPNIFIHFRHNFGAHIHTLWIFAQIFWRFDLFEASSAFLIVVINLPLHTAHRIHYWWRFCGASITLRLFFFHATPALYKIVSVALECNPFLQPRVLVYCHLEIFVLYRGDGLPNVFSVAIWCSVALIHGCAIHGTSEGLRYFLRRIYFCLRLLLSNIVPFCRLHPLLLLLSTRD